MPRTQVSENAITHSLILGLPSASSRMIPHLLMYALNLSRLKSSVGKPLTYLAAQMSEEGDEILLART
jgi:hypothetical protein